MSIESKKETMAKYTGEKRTPIKAMRAYCLSCCMESSHEVRLCTVHDCPLFPFRLGENSFNMTEVSEDRKEAARARLYSLHRKTRLRIDAMGETDE